MSIHVIYARKSTESDDRQVLSIDSQIRELHAIAARRGIAIGEVLTEAKSAKAPGRPVFGALLKRIDKGEVSSIVCWKMDRLARNHLDTGSVLQALADGKLQEVITSDRTYTRDGNDRFMGNFEFGMATKFIDDLRANVRRGNRARFQRGWPNFIPPLGYLNDVLAKTIVKDPARFDLVRRMWELLLSGAFRPAKIRTIANEDWGFRTRTFRRSGGNPLSNCVLYSLFKNPFYMGVIRLKTGERFPGAFPAMVTREEFQRAQEIIGRPRRPRPQRHEFPFTGLIACGNCGAGVTAEEHVKPSGRRYVYYHCSHSRPGRPCREPAISATDLEQQIVGALERLAIPERILEWVLARVSRSLRDEEERRITARRSLETSVASLARESENLLSLRLRDLVTDDAYVARKRDLDERRVEVERKLGAPPRSAEDLAEAVAGTFRFASRAAETFRNGSGVQQRMILEAVSSNSQLQARKLRITAKKPFQVISDAGGIFNWCTSVQDVRTWIQDTTEYFTLPDLRIGEDGLSAQPLDAV